MSDNTPKKLPNWAHTPFLIREHIGIIGYKLKDGKPLDEEETAYLVDAFLQIYHDDKIKADKALGLVRPRRGATVKGHHILNPVAVYVYGQIERFREEGYTLEDALTEIEQSKGLFRVADGYPEDNPFAEQRTHSRQPVPSRKTIEKMYYDIKRLYDKKKTPRD